MSRFPRVSLFAQVTRLPAAGSQTLPRGFAYFRPSTTVPRFVQHGALDLNDLVHDFGAGSGLHGSGAHLGDGVVLTAGHVLKAWLRPEIRFTAEGFAGSATYDFGKHVLMLPSPGSYNGQRAMPIDREALGSYRDFALIQADERRGQRGFESVRATADLEPNEPIWVVGGKTGPHTFISEGTYLRLEGQDNAVLQSFVEPGFSGSPALDEQGRLVGLVVAASEAGLTWLVRTEPIAREAQRLMPHSPIATWLSALQTAKPSGSGASSAEMTPVDSFQPA